MGYTSTSKNFEKALEFAFVDCSGEQVAVVFEIYFHGQSGLFEMDDSISAYSGEEEVLLQDGLEYRVLNNQQRINHDS